MPSHRPFPIRSLALLVGLLFLLGSSPAEAQRESGRPAGADTSRQAMNHRLMPGDQVEVHILSLPEMERLFTIRSDGGFYHPLVGEVQVAGRTLQDLQSMMESRLARELRNPTVRVGLKALAREDVTVLGEVVHPGKYDVAPGTTLLDVLAMAGGNSPRADLSSAVLMREGKQQTVSLAPPDPNATESQQVQVQPGDILYVLPGTEVSVSGDVFTPGVYALPRSEATPLRALRAAGGTRPGAALYRVVLQRATLEQPLVLDLSDPDAPLPEPARILQAGDMLRVPPRQVVLLGGVNQVGPQTLEGGENVLEVIMRAGVADPKKLSDVTIIRAADIKAGRQKTEKVDLTPYIEKADTSVLVPVFDGDVVYVPKDEPGGGFNFLNSIFFLRGLFGPIF